MAMVLAIGLAACGSGDPSTEDEASRSTTTTQPSDAVPAVGGDTPEPSGTDTPATTEGEVDPACADFRALVAPNAPCDALVTSVEEPICTVPTGAALDCSAVPSVARVARASGAVVGGQPLRPTGDVVQFGSGPGPTNTSLLLSTNAPLPATTEDQLELAVVYEAPRGAGCVASGEAWDGASFVTILRLGPGPARVTDLGCKSDGFNEISQRTSWLVSGDVVLVHLPIDLPGVPARVTGTFRSAPEFAFDDGRIFTRRLDTEAWDFAEPIDP